MNETVTLNYGGDDPQKWISRKTIHFTYINSVLTFFLQSFDMFFLVLSENLTFKG